MRRSRRRRRRDAAVADLNVAPLMNLFVAIVPMLLLSAVFVSMAGIELSMPALSEVPQKPSDFVLALHLTPEAWRVEARGEDSLQLPHGDVAGLLRALEDLHAAHPEHTSVLVACSASVSYADVVQVLDVAAVAGFSDCALSGIGAGNLSPSGLGAAEPLPPASEVRQSRATVASPAAGRAS